jgi:hypothetical protein
MTSIPADLGALLGDAGLDDETAASIVLTADTLGPAIQAGLGDITLDDVKSSELTLVTQVVDDSTSIRMEGNSQPVREGHNLVLDALGGSKQASSLLISTRLLNRDVLFPYRPLSGAVRLDTSNYNPSGGTPLYEQTDIVLTSVGIRMAEFDQGGVTVRSVTAIITDGADSEHYDPRNPENPNVPPSLTQKVKGLLKSERHIIIGVGISDVKGKCFACGFDLDQAPPDDNKCPSCHNVVGTDFKRVFREMGIRDEWILTPKNTPHEIREAFATVSQSAVRASQAAGTGFSQVALGGFGS